MRIRLVACFMAAGFCRMGVASATAAERPWSEVTSPHFVVVSNAGEKEARHVAWLFEQCRSAFNTVWPWGHVRPGRRFVVIAVRDEASLRELNPEFWERKGGIRPGGVFLSGVDKDYVSLRTDLTGPDEVGVNPYYLAYAGYADIVLTATFPRSLPLWFRRGLTALFSSTNVRDKDVQMGRPIPWHMQELSQTSRIRLATLLAADRDSPYYTQESESRVFDAESWALVHYLAFGEDRAHLPQLNRYAEMLRAGTDPDRAFKEALGSVDGLEGRLSNYLSRRIYSYVQFNVDVGVKAEGFTVRPLSMAAAAAARAGYLANSRRPAEARALIAQARAAEPDLAAAYEAEGVLDDIEGKTDDARAAFGKAVERASDDFYAYTRYADLLRSRAPSIDKDTLARIADALESAVRLNGESAETYARLAEARSDLSPGELPVSLARRAVALAPDAASSHLSLARVLWQASEHAAGREEAEKALKLAAGDVAAEGEARRLLAYFQDDERAEAARNEAELASRCQAGEAAACGQWAQSLEHECQGGQLGPCGALAWLLQGGHGLPKDAARAAALYQKACEGGELRACTNLGILHLQGDGVAKNRRLASDLLSKACQGGEANACDVLRRIPH